ncbi:MAG: hypothetical protein JXR10_17965 [Cyclobacteriaceae bacterium]
MKNKLKLTLGGIGGFIVIAIFSQLGGEIGKKAFTEFTKTEIDINKPWFRNALYGFSFETPEKVKKLAVEKPLGYEDYLNIFETHMLEHGDLIVFFLYMDTNFEDYDTEVGLQGSIQNSVNSLEGSNLSLEYSKPEGQLNDLIANGTFNWRDKEMLARGYIYWNGNGKVVVLATYIPNEQGNTDIIDKIFDSRRVAF